MALEHTKLDIVNESRNPSKIDDKTLALVFGKPDSPKPDNFEMNDVEKNHGKQNGNTEDKYTSSFPLLESERETQKPPLAGPEIDDLDGTTPANDGPYPGIGDGLVDAKDDKPHILDVDESDLDDKSNPETRDDAVGTDDGKWPWLGGDEPDYPYDINNLSPRFGEDVRPMSPVSPYIDVNTYQQKKNLAQGMMDLALLSANANQLRYVLESSTSHPYFYSSLVFITLSIIFQIAVGVGLILNSKYDVNDKEEICKADKINNFTVLGIFLITIVNVFITSFSVATPTVLVATPPVP